MEIGLRALQKDAVIIMFNLNNRESAISSGLVKTPLNTKNIASKRSRADPENISVTEPIWKVLVYDGKGQDIISPLLKVNELRENGITVHMQLSQDRYPIPDVPAIYFMEPTLDNVQLLARDLEKGLYESYYINFTHCASRDVLEQLASVALQTGTHQKIAQVFDQYLNFFSNESRMFSSGISDSFRILNSSSSTEDEIQTVVNSSVQSLFSVIATMGVVPVIRCQKGGASEMLGKRLEQKLRDHMLQSTQPPSSSAPRPVLILLDRNTDLSAMLQHTWNYATLIHDVLGLKSNRIVVQIDEQGRKVRKIYDLDSSDFFWLKNASALFPQVAEDVDAEINRYKTDIEQVTRSANVSSLNEIDGADFSTNTNALKAAITQLPELTDRKRIIDMHMNIATSLLNSIQERNLDKLFETEESIVTKALSVSKFAQVLEHIKSDDKASPEDKMRLFLVFYLSTSVEQDLTKSEWAQVEHVFKDLNVSTSAMSYVHQIRSLGRMTASAGKSAGGSTLMERTRSAGIGSAIDARGANADEDDGHKLFNPFSSLSTHLSSHLKDGSSLFSGVGGAYSSIVAGFKNLMPSRKDLAVARIVEALMEGGAISNGVPNLAGSVPSQSRGASSTSGAKGIIGDENDDFMYLDPKLPPQHKLKTPSLPAAGQTFKHAIVYVSGGGNYHEYQNLTAMCQRHNVGTAGGASKGNDDAIMSNLLNLASSAQGTLSLLQRTITYGATDIVSPISFLKQLDILGNGTGNLLLETNLIR